MCRAGERMADRFKHVLVTLNQWHSSSATRKVKAHISMGTPTELQYADAAVLRASLSPMTSAPTSKACSLSFSSSRLATQTNVLAREPTDAALCEQLATHN